MAWDVLSWDVLSGSHLQVSSADKFCKLFGQYVGPDLDQNCLTLMVFSKEFFEKDFDGENSSRRQKKYANSPSRQRINNCCIFKKIRVGLIFVNFPKHIDTISMELPIVYFKGSNVEHSKLRCISAPEGCFNLSKQRRRR